MQLALVALCIRNCLARHGHMLGPGPMPQVRCRYICVHIGKSLNIASGYAHEALWELFEHSGVDSDSILELQLTQRRQGKVNNMPISRIR